MSVNRLIRAAAACGAAALVCACAATPAQDAATAAELKTLAGTTWMMKIPKGHACEVPPEIEFRKDGTVRGNSACNDFSGTWKADGDRLSVSVKNTTQRKCGKAFAELETAFGGALRSFASVRKEGNGLLLRDAGGKTLVTIVPALAGACD